MDIKILNFDIKGDELGYLISLEAGKNVPFQIKRTYFIFDIDVRDVRGKHVHRKLCQLLVVARGKCKILFDDGKERKTVELSKPNQGALIPPRVWHEMSDFSPDCMLVVLADDLYDESDYIRNYDEFLKWVRQ